MASKRKGFGPVQLATHAGLENWHIDRGRVRGLVPAPALPSGRWSDEQADELHARREEVIEALGTHPGYGAKRGAQMLVEALFDEQVDVWYSDVEDLVERGLLDRVGSYKDFDLYDPRQLSAPTPEMAAALREIIAERTAWLEESLRTREAAGRCGFTVAEFEKAAREAGVAIGRWERWALADVERLADNADLGDDVRAARLLGPDLAAQHLEIRRVDFDHCVQAGWIAPVSSTVRRYGVRRDVEVPLYQVGDLDSMLDLPGIDWEAVRATPPGRPSPLAEFVRLAPTRAARMHALAQQVTERFHVPAWAHYHPGPDRWTLDWLPGEQDGASGPALADVKQFVAAAGLSGGVTLLSEAIATVHWARAMLAPGRAVLVDTETTGIPGHLVEVAAVDCATGDVLLDTLVRPGEPISPGARAVHGITDAEAADAPTLATVLPDLLAATRQRTVLAYNAEFDRQCITLHCHDEGLDPRPLADPATWDCLMENRSGWEGTRQWLPLGGGTHRALGDVRAAHRLLRRLAEPPTWALPAHLRPTVPEQQPADRTPAGRPA
ncbi:3'-5' exonuclease [Streptomyces sp. NPDC004031]